MVKKNEGIAFMDDHIYHFNHGNHYTAYKFLGTKAVTLDGVKGFQFSVWAPNAYQVYLQGDFSDWANLTMENREGGFWTLFVPEAKQGQYYKYGIDHGEGHIEYKMDPFGYRFEKAPGDATIVWDIEKDFDWQDDQWQAKKPEKNQNEEPMNIYEVHASSWRRHPDGSYYTLKELADALIDYVVDMGYTHVEFMPLMDHPLEASWGYQITGFYGLSPQFGEPEDLKYFVNKAHQAGIGVLLDWVPGHYSRNNYALAYFDGTPQYEYADQNRADNIRWGTLNFDLGKNQVQSFLISNAIFWLKEFHIDGLRVDAVSNILYLDADIGPWTPNIYGHNLSLEGIDFLRKLNSRIHEELPGTLMIAEESTNYEGITSPVSEGGLGFDYKWNMGWMNDILKFFEMDPAYRPYHLNLVTFVFMYQFNEKYILPISHDEVVHGKNSLLGKMPGDRYNQFAGLRTFHAYMMAQPGKKLSFMGNELGQFLEWRYYDELEWEDLNREYNSEYHEFIKELNHFGQDHKPLYELDHSPEGITYLDADDDQDAVLTFIRHSKDPEDFIVVVCNFVNRQHEHYRLGLPFEGTYEVVLNTEMQQYGGTWLDGHADLKTEKIPHNHQEFSTELVVPALSVLYIQPKKIQTKAEKNNDNQEGSKRAKSKKK